MREEALRAFLGPYAATPVLCLGQTDSTNLQMKALARRGEIRAPFLLTADSQTAGRGRLGRAFLSPAEDGLYMSVLVRLRPEARLPVTILAAAAVCRAVEEACGLFPRVKWVNDLFLRGKKICGILAEGLGEQAVVGIGLNLRTPPGGYPGVAVAGALDCAVSREEMAGRITANLLSAQTRPEAEILEAYRARMPLVGREIRYTQNGQEKSARVTGVDETGGLMILGEGGPEVLRCGEVSLGSQAFSGLE